MKSQTNTKLRTDKCWDSYQAVKQEKHYCFMCQEPAKNPIRKYTYWTIIANTFPYDAVASTHHLLVPNRHLAAEDALTAFEMRELETIKQSLGLQAEYDCIMHNFPAGQSQPQHLHYHLITWLRN